jgi:hypothetical protein
MNGGVTYGHVYLMVKVSLLPITKQISGSRLNKFKDSVGWCLKRQPLIIGRSKWNAQRLHKLADVKPNYWTPNSVLHRNIAALQNKLRQIIRKRRMCVFPVISVRRRYSLFTCNFTIFPVNNSPWFSGETRLRSASYHRTFTDVTERTIYLDSSDYRNSFSFQFVKTVVEVKIRLSQLLCTMP